MDQYAVQDAAMYAALERYGITKVAGAVDTFKRIAYAPFRSRMPTSPRPGFWGGVKDVAQGIGDMGRAMVFGSPVDAYHQFQHLRKDRGALGAYGHMLKDWFWSTNPPDATTGDKAINWMNRAGTIVDLGNNALQVAQGDPDQRWGDVTALGASLVAAPVTGHLGMFAGHKVNTMLTDAARSLGHRLDPKTPKGARPPAYAPPSTPRSYMRPALRGASDDFRTPEGGLVWNSSTEGVTP